ncbi:unnamed protein product [Darwinula stevensoni]|uniref:Major facilitator superfamily (MFS) profile domain-containing protein n=1 Tax=Darwinula stevensoni TaxID=69355 RepID=A0A7R9A2J8_9CRUS|nr:unnamed protein product [Darwinula stevensoni]CAG0889835.1 unnamed protein product [Darwinula stevensoni]
MMPWCFRDLPFKKKRYITFAISFASNFIGGTEFAIILPSIWRYLQQLGVTNEAYLGLVTSSFSLASLFSGMLVGYWTDRSGDVRKIALFMNLFQIAGNLFYFIGFFPWILLLGRFISGIGAGLNTVMYAEVSRSTTAEERTSVLTCMFALRQLSMSFAPAYNLAIANINFQLGGIQVTEENFPGLLMAVICIIFEFVFFFLYFNLSEEFQLEEKRRMAREAQSSYGACDSRTSLGEELEKELLQKSFSSPDCKTEEGEEVRRTRTSLAALDVAKLKDEPPFKTLEVYRREFLKVSVIALLLSQMTAYLCQTLIETIIPPVMQIDFGLGNRENSYLYMATGGESLVIYVIVILASKWGIQERSMILCGSAVIVYALVHNLLLGLYLLPDTPDLLPYFVAGCMVMFAGVPAVCVCTMCLTTKLVDRRAQGLLHGVRRAYNSMGIVIGPLWGGGFVFEPIPLYILPLAFVLLYAIHYFVSALKLPPR